MPPREKYHNNATPKKKIFDQNLSLIKWPWSRDLEVDLENFPNKRTFWGPKTVPKQGKLKHPPKSPQMRSKFDHHLKSINYA